MDDFPHLLRIHPVIPHDQAPTRFKTKARVTRGRFPALKGRRPTYTSPRDLYKKCWAVLKPVSSQFTEKGCRPEPADEERLERSSRARASESLIEAYRGATRIRLLCHASMQCGSRITTVEQTPLR